MAGENSIQVTISNGGIDLTAYLVKLQRQAAETNKKLQDDAKEQLRMSQDQLDLINDQIDALTRLSNLETAIARRRRDAYREQRQAEMELNRIRAAGNAAAIRSGNGNVRSFSSTNVNMTQVQIVQMNNGTDSIVQAIDEVRQEINQLGEKLQPAISGAGGNANSNNPGGSSGNGGGNNGNTGSGNNSNAADPDDDGLSERSDRWNKRVDRLASVLGAVGSKIDGAIGSTNSYQLIEENETDIAKGAAKLILGSLSTYFLKDASIGVKAGDAIGEFIGKASGAVREKHQIAMQEFEARTNKISALQGGFGEVKVPRLTEYGVDPYQSAELMEQIAIRGGMKDAFQNTQDFVEISKGYNVSPEALMRIIDLQSTYDGWHSLKNLVGGIMKGGITSNALKSNDLTGLSDYLNKYADVYKLLSLHRSGVTTGFAANLMTTFNEVGGQFETSHAQGISNIAKVQEGLTNPGSDSMKTLSFMMLRRLNPQAGIFDLFKMQEEGIAGPNGVEYMNAMLDYAHRYGGNSDMGKLVLKNMFPQLDFAATEDLWNRGSAFKKGVDNKWLDNQPSDFDFDGMASYHTTTMEKETAEDKELWLKDVSDILGGLVTRSVDAIQRAFDGSKIVLENGYIQMKGVAPALDHKPGNAAQYKTVQMEGRLAPRTPDVK